MIFNKTKWIVMTKKLTLFSVSVLTSSFLWAGQGSAGAQFLQIFNGVHGAALAGAFTAYNGGAESVYWNPACIREVQNISTHMSHADYFAGMKYANVAVTIPSGFGTLGLSGVGLLSGDIEETTVIEDEGTGHTFTANDYALGLSFARAMTNKFDAGITVKLINQNLAKVSATSWAMDFGALYKTGLFANLRLGFCVRNFGPDMQYRGEGLINQMERSEVNNAEEDLRYELLSAEYSLPMSFHIGAVMEFKLPGASRMMLNLDANNSVDQKEAIATAVEWQYPDFIYVSLGHANMAFLTSPGVSDQDLGGNMRGLTLGAGVNFGKFTGKPFWVAYAWESHKYLNAIQRVGIELAF